MSPDCLTAAAAFVNRAAVERARVVDQMRHQLVAGCKAIAGTCQRVLSGLVKTLQAEQQIHLSHSKSVDIAAQGSPNLISRWGRNRRLIVWVYGSGSDNWDIIMIAVWTRTSHGLRIGHLTFG